jgi:nucleoside-diphosphate-sugar epimerase
MHGIDEVYHAAALVSYRRKDAAKLINTNTEGTANVVNIAIDAGVRKFCHISSVAAVGLPLKGLANEETVWKRSAQRSMYGFSKYLAEQEVWRGAAEGMPCVIVNPSVILGPAKPYQSSGALMHLFQKGPAYYPPGTAGFVDVRDVSSACIALMDSEKQNERYILNAGSVPFRQMLNHAAAVFGNKPPQVAIKPWMLELAWPLAALWATLTQTQASITRETARNACKALYYDSSKVQKAIGLEFISAEESLAYYKPFIEGL